MAINVSVQYNGGLLPDIILLTKCYYHRNHLRQMTAFLEKGGMEAKYPRLRSEKIMTAYLGYEVDVMKKNERLLPGFNWF